MNTGLPAAPAVTFYFSFRSPYGWLAFHRWSKIAGRLPVAVHYVPLIPPPHFPGDPAANPRKAAYVAEDVGRFAKAYGLAMQWPKPFDGDWKGPHASFLFAVGQGRAVDFALATFEARFCRGEDISDRAILAKVAVQCGLDQDAVVRSADDPALQARVAEGAVLARQEGAFGVPFFVYGERHYWGNDRLEWLLKDIFAEAKQDCLPAKGIFSHPFQFI